MLSAQEKEIQYQRRLKQQMREHEARRFIDAERDFGLRDVWVAHVWAPENGVPEKGEWLFAGFRRRRNRRKPQTMGRFFSKVRRQLGIEKSSPVLLMDLDMASRRIHGADQQWRFRAPQFQRRKQKMEQRTPVIRKGKLKRRATVKASLLNKRNTRFIALGRNAWDRRSGHLYLGPLTEEHKRLAQSEAKRMFPIYTDLLVIATEDLSPPLRHAMSRRNSRVQAGVTRIRWPEIPPGFDEVYAKYLRRHVSEEEERQIHSERFGATLHQRWSDEVQPWLTVAWFRKAMRLMLTPSKIIYSGRGQFACSVCKRTGSSPSSISHGSPECVPIPEQENATCADAARNHAKRKNDRKRKRLGRRAEQKMLLERARARKRAAKKAARTRAKRAAIIVQQKTPSIVRRVVRAILKTAHGKTSGRSSKRASNNAFRSSTSVRRKTNASRKTSVRE